MARSALVWVVLMAVGCKPPPQADPDFNDALVFAFRAFEGSEANLAFALRDLEKQSYLAMDVEAPDVQSRALEAARLSEEDLGELEHPDRDPALALPVAVAGVSAFGPEDHARIQLLADQRPVEPYSPEKYNRTFFEGEDCWLDQGCMDLRTSNDLLKDNILMTLDYILLKDFRWVDLNLPAPSTVPEGEEPVNDGDKRWAIAARAWTNEVAEGEAGNARLWQSYTIQAWIPRDGGGYVRSADDKNVDDGDWTADSTAGGGLSLLCLWAETEFDGLDVSEDTTASTTRGGMEKNMDAAETWLEENP